MPPNQSDETVCQYKDYHNDEQKTDGIRQEKKEWIKNAFSTRQPINWLNAIVIPLFHIYTIYVIIAYTFRVKILTIVWSFVVGIGGGIGVTAGVHRLWSHRSYKAKLPLQIILLILYSTTGMNSIYAWVRDHRVHHKYTETEADPHNSKRGFFFSHVGWLMQRKNPEVLEKGRIIDMSDITSDPLLTFHTKYFVIIKILFCFLLPSLVPIYCWNENWVHAFLSQCFVRYMFLLNMTWSVNSFAHMYGTKPYDKRIGPKENFGVALVSLGEGWHNYHHVFPWDYKAAEFGNYKLNLTTMFLDYFVKIGWAYDMKTASKELVQKTIEKYGDGSYTTIPEIPFEENYENKSE